MRLIFSGLILSNSLTDWLLSPVPFFSLESSILSFYGGEWITFLFGDIDWSRPVELRMESTWELVWTSASLSKNSFYAFLSASRKNYNSSSSSELGDGYTSCLIFPSISCRLDSSSTGEISSTLKDIYSVGPFVLDESIILVCTTYPSFPITSSRSWDGDVLDEN